MIRSHPELSQQVHVELGLGDELADRLGNTFVMIVVKLTLKVLITVKVTLKILIVVKVTLKVFPSS